MDREFIEEPDPQDDEDPEYKEEMFQTYLSMGWTAKDLKDPAGQREYAEWLKKSTPPGS